MSEQYASSYELLEIFAYGTWGDYAGAVGFRVGSRATQGELTVLAFAAKQASLPTLTKPQEIKLKQLTILSLAMENRVRATPFWLRLTS